MSTVEEQKAEPRDSRGQRRTWPIAIAVISLLVGFVVGVDAAEAPSTKAESAAEAGDAAEAAGNPPAGAPENILEQKPLYSQQKEELYIRHFFDDMRDGVYVDVGAWEWEKNSTTAYLAKHLGWSGIAIDAHPGLAEGWKEHRPNAKFFSYIVTDHAGTKDPFYLTYGISSTDPEHIKSFRRMKDRRQKVVEVETITLTDLLDREGVEQIDFLSMDIEGGEPKALAGFDIDRFRPRLVCIEAGPAGSDRQAAIAKYFEEHGYRRIKEYERKLDPNWYLTPIDPAPAER